MNALTEVLSRHGYLVNGYTDPDAALATFKAGEFELAIVDYRMPVYNGIVVLQALRKNDPDIKLALFTAYDLAQEDLPQDLKPPVGSVAMISKPLTIAQMKESIDRILS